MDTYSRRRFLGTSLLFVGGVALSGCQTDPQATGDAKVTLSQWFHGYGEAGTEQAARRYAAEFTKAHPDIAVKVTWLPGTDDYETRLNAALLTDEAPDLFEIGDFRYERVKRGEIAPLDDIYGDAKADFNAADLDGLTVDGKIYGVKMIDDVMMLYYRRSVLEAANVKPPQTFAELLDAAKKLTTAKQKGLFVANNGIGDAAYLLNWSNGGELVEGGKVAFDSAKSVEAIGALRRLHEAKVLLLDFTSDWYDPGALIQGAAAMHWCGLWAMPGIKKELGDDFGVLPWPAFNATGKPAARLGGWAQLVNAKSKHLEEAKKFTRWMWIEQAELQKDWCVSYGFHIPPRASIAAQTPQLSVGAAKEAAEISAKHSKSFPNLWGQAMATAFSDAVGNIVGGADATAALGEAAKIAQADLDKQLA